MKKILTYKTRFATVVALGVWCTCVLHTSDAFAQQTLPTNDGEPSVPIVVPEDGRDAREQSALPPFHPRRRHHYSDDGPPGPPLFLMHISLYAFGGVAISHDADGVGSPGNATGGAGVQLGLPFSQVFEGRIGIDGRVRLFDSSLRSEFLKTITPALGVRVKFGRSHTFFTDIDVGWAVNYGALADRVRDGVVVKGGLGYRGYLACFGSYEDFAYELGVEVRVGVENDRHNDAVLFRAALDIGFGASPAVYGGQCHVIDPVDDDHGLPSLDAPRLARALPALDESHDFAAATEGPGRENVAASATAVVANTSTAVANTPPSSAPAYSFSAFFREPGGGLEVDPAAIPTELPTNVDLSVYLHGRANEIEEAVDLLRDELSKRAIHLRGIYGVIDEDGALRADVFQ